MKRFNINFVVYLLGTISLFVILVIEFDLPFNFGTSEYGLIINKLLLNIMYSLFAASLFHVFTVQLPFYKKRAAVRVTLNLQLSELQNEINYMRFSLNPFFDEPIKNKPDFIVWFESKDLSEPFLLGITKNANINDYLNEERFKLKGILYQILDNQDYLRHKELDCILRVLTSDFITKDLVAINYNVDENMRINLWDNQRQIGASIFDIIAWVTELNLD